MIGCVAAEGGYAVVLSPSKKVKKYGARCEAEAMAFLPLAVDTLGIWHKEALETISKLSSARVLGRDKGETVQHLRQGLVVVLVRDNVNMLASRAPKAVPSQTSGLL